MPQVTMRSKTTPRVNVNVTADIIETSKKGDSSHCMIADAIRVAVPGAKRVAVDIFTCRFTDPKWPRRYIYITPRVGQSAILDFDQGNPVEPFQFRLQGGQLILGRSLQGLKDADAVKRGKRSAQVRKEQGLQPYFGPYFGKKGPQARLHQSSDTKVKGNITKIGGRAPGQFAIRREFGARRFVRGVAAE